MQQPVKMIRINSLLLVIGRQVIIFPHIVWNQAITVFIFRDYAFVNAKHVNDIKIKVSGLKQSHDLQTIGLTFHSDRHLSSYLKDKHL